MCQRWWHVGFPASLPVAAWRGYDTQTPIWEIINSVYQLKWHFFLTSECMRWTSIWQRWKHVRVPRHPELETDQIILSFMSHSTWWHHFGQITTELSCFFFSVLWAWNSSSDPWQMTSSDPGQMNPSHHPSSLTPSTISGFSKLYYSLLILLQTHRNWIHSSVLMLDMKALI